MAFWDDDDSGMVGSGAVKGAIGGTGAIPSSLGKGIAGGLGFGHEHQDALSDQSSAMTEEEAKKNRESLGKMNSDANNYEKELSGYTNDYLSNLDRNRQESQAMASNARQVYSNDINPRLKSSMEDAQRQSSQAMSLADAGNVNNSVHQGVRGLYDQQGQGVRNQGIADYGVLSALGSQATQNTMGAGGPMTGSQMQLLNAGNQQQAGQAFQRAQQNMQRLKEQGINRGFEESDKQYNRGQQAKDRYQGSIENYESGMDRNNARQKGFRDEDMGYNSDRFGMQKGMSQTHFENQNASNNRDMAQTGAEYGNRQAQIANQMAAANAENASKRGILGGMVQAGGAGVGAMMGGAAGGPQGAAYGASAGNNITSGFSQGIQGGQPQQQQGSYPQQQRRY